MSKRLIYAEDAIEEIIRRLGIKDESYLTAQEKAVVQVLKDMPPTQPQDIARDIANIIENEKDMRVMLQQRWIPVSERLPEVGQWVLCQCRAGIIDVLRLTDDDCWYRKSNEIYMSGFVIAWMPLPEPYKGEQE